MKSYAKQWRTLNTSWPEDCDLIDIVYQPPDKEGFVVYNVGFFLLVLIIFAQYCQPENMFLANPNQKLLELLE